MSMIPVDRILPNPKQPRHVFDHEDLENLSASIAAHGLINPISVEEAPNGYYILIDGERRVRAARMAGLKDIPAGIRSADHDQARLELALIANIHRVDLNPIEEAESYRAMMDLYGLSAAQVALRLKVNRVRIDNRLALLALDRPIQDLIAKDRLFRDARLARALVDIPDREARIELAERMANSSLSLMPAIRAAQRVRKNMVSKPIANDDSDPMSIKLAKKDSRTQKMPNQDWNMLFQVGKVPRWQTVADAAMNTCDTCALKPVASEENCSDCPAVQMLRRMMDTKP